MGPFGTGWPRSGFCNSDTEIAWHSNRSLDRDGRYGLAVVRLEDSEELNCATQPPPDDRDGGDHHKKPEPPLESSGGGLLVRLSHQ